MNKPFVRAAIAALGFYLVLRLGVRGVLPTAGVAVLAPAALLTCAFYLLKRDNFWSVAIGTVIGLPLLGAGGLVDPWETHYAEVAREMIERRDFLSPWWANEGWFTTKPVLTFWLEAASMVALGVKTGPHLVLPGHPEWAIRLPHFFFALAGSTILADGVARTTSRRAGLIGALVLWTMPGYALLSHQALTDMPLVAGIAASLGLLLRAFSTSDEEQASPAFIRVTVGFLALCIVPQLLVIALQSRQLISGSPHACGLPSQPNCAAQAFAHPRLAPMLQTAIWLVPSSWLALRITSETRKARLFALLAWAFAALAAMAKGPAGLAIPVAAVAVHAVVKRDWRQLLRLEIPTGLALAATFILPWYLAVYARNGRGFVEELVMRHMLGRTLDHLHDTNEGEDVGIIYFVRQLAYATFPWSGIATLSIFSAKEERNDRGQTRALLFGAAIVSFALVSSMRTKFHHYGLLTIPPIAMLTGMGIDEILRPRAARARLLVPALVTGLIGWELIKHPAQFILLLSYRYTRAWPSTAGFASTFFFLTCAACLALLLATRYRAALGLLAAAAVSLSVTLLDSYLLGCGRDGGQRDVLAEYYKDRGANDAPLVAYQLNWKGENFYTANQLALFIASGAPMKTWLEKHRGKAVYFVTERGRVSGLKRELGSPSDFVELTKPEASAEFTLVRATL